MRIAHAHWWCVCGMSVLVISSSAHLHMRNVPLPPPLETAVASAAARG